MQPNLNPSSIKQSHSSLSLPNSALPYPVPPIALSFPASQPSKSSPFSRPSIFKSDQKHQSQPEVKPHKIQSNHLEKPIITRQVVKKLAKLKEGAMKKKLMHPRPSSKDLTLIHEDSGEYVSSNESGFITESSMNESNSESEGSQYWGAESKWQQEQSLPSQYEENLDKTVLMSKKKVPQPPVQAQKHQNTMSEHELRLKELITKYDFQKLQRLYQEGKIVRKDYEIMLQMKKKQMHNAKDERFTESMEKVKQSAVTIFNKYANLYRKLSKDISGTELKINELQEHLKQSINSQNPFNPQKIRCQLKICQKQSELEAKKQICNNLKQFIEEINQKYNEHLCRLKEEEEKPCFSQTLHTKEIKDFFKLTHQLYNSIIRSLMKNQQTGTSVVKEKAQQHYIKKLSEKYAEELKAVSAVNVKYMIEFAELSFDKLNEADDITEEMFAQLADLSTLKIYQGLQSSKALLYDNIAFLNMVRKDKQLKSGKIYQNALQCLDLHPSSQLPYEKFMQKIVVKNFKFFQKNVLNMLLIRVQPIHHLHILLQTRQQASKLRAQSLKFSNLMINLQAFERDILSIDSVFIRIKFSKKLPNFQGKSSRSENIKSFLKEKHQKYEKLHEKASAILKQESNEARRSLISKKKVLSLDFRKNKEETKKPLREGKISWKELIESKQTKSFMDPEQNSMITERQKNRKIFDYDSKLQIECNKKQFAEEMSQIFKASEKQWPNEEAKRKHLDRVYDLISRNQIHSQKYETKTKSEPYHNQNESIFEQMLDSVQLTGCKPSFDSFCRSFDRNSSDFKQVSREIQVSSMEESDKWLKYDQSLDEIENACQLFAREYHRNPLVRDTLKLKEHQFNFLMSPDYRKHFMQKKQRDKQLTDKMTEIIRLSTHRNMDPCGINPIRYMIESDSYLQQKISEYQQKMVKNEKVTDANQPRLMYDFDEVSTCDSQDYEILERRVKELEEKSMNEYYWRKYEERRRWEERMMEQQDGHVWEAQC